MAEPGRVAKMLEHTAYVGGESPCEKLVVERDVRALRRDTDLAGLRTSGSRGAEGDTVAHAADVLAERGIHRLFVVDGQGALVGALSIVDVLRALTGKAVHHPAALPHVDDATGVTWTDDEPFELSASDAAPNGPGVLLLVKSVTGEPDDIALVEAPANVRARLLELLSAPPSERPDLMRLLEHPSRLRFRAAPIDDARKRGAVARTILVRAARDLRGAVLR